MSSLRNRWPQARWKECEMRVLCPGRPHSPVHPCGESWTGQRRSMVRENDLQNILDFVHNIACLEIMGVRSGGRGFMFFKCRSPLAKALVTSDKNKNRAKPSLVQIHGLHVRHPDIRP